MGGRLREKHPDRRVKPRHLLARGRRGDRRSVRALNAQQPADWDGWPASSRTRAPAAAAGRRGAYGRQRRAPAGRSPSATAAAPASRRQGCRPRSPLRGPAAGRRQKLITRGAHVAARGVSVTRPRRLAAGEAPRTPAREALRPARREGRGARTKWERRGRVRENRGWARAVGAPVEGGREGVRDRQRQAGHSHQDRRGTHLAAGVGGAHECERSGGR